jgi:hypothetical protein
MHLLRHAGLCSLLIAAVGCATTPPTVDAPPLAEDLGWSAPAPVKPPAAEPPATPAEPERPRSSKEKVYAFTAGESYRVDVAVGAPMDVILQPGRRSGTWPMATGRPWTARIRSRTGSSNSRIPVRG